jgi:hypothetical protein
MAWIAGGTYIVSLEDRVSQLQQLKAHFPALPMTLVTHGLVP